MKPQPSIAIGGHGIVWAVSIALVVLLACGLGWLIFHGGHQPTPANVSGKGQVAVVAGPSGPATTSQNAFPKPPPAPPAGKNPLPSPGPEAKPAGPAPAVKQSPPAEKLPPARRSRRQRRTKPPEKLEKPPEKPPEKPAAKMTVPGVASPAGDNRPARPARSPRRRPSGSPFRTRRLRRGPRRRFAMK